jgi:hypothetical protein
MEFLEQVDRAARQSRLGVSIAAAVAALCVGLGVYVQSGKSETVSFFREPAAPAAPAGVNPQLIDLAIVVQGDLARLNFFLPDSFRRVEQTMALLQPLEGQASLELQRRLGVLLDLRQRLLVIRQTAPEAAAQADSILDRSLAANKRFSADDPLIKPVLAALEALQADSVQIAQPDSGRIDPLLMHSNLKALIAGVNEAVQAVKAGRATERQREFVARAEKSALVRVAPDWESALFALIAVTDDLAKTLQPLAAASPPSPPGQPTGVEFGRQALAQSLFALAFASLLFGVVIVFQQTGLLAKSVHDQSSTPRNGASQNAVMVVSENLNYLKLVTKQLSELGRQLAASIKKLARSSSDVHSASADQGASDASSQELLSLKTSLQDLSAACVALREQSIQLSILLAEESSAARALDSSDRLVEQLEHIESLAQRIGQGIDASRESLARGTSAGSADSETERLREIEGVLVLVSQWQRQFDRLGLAVDEISKTVEALGAQSQQNPGAGNTASGDGLREPVLG